MVCPDCHKFPSKDTETEPEGSLDVDATGTITGDVRIFNNCAECGTELEECTFNVEIDLTDEVAAHMKEKHDGVEHGIELHSESIERTDETKTVDRRGKPIRNPRYMKRLYGITVSATLRCDECGEDIDTGTYADSVQASGMESLV